MPYQEFQENWKSFSELMDKLTSQAHPDLQMLVNRYIEQNVIFLNDVFSSSIENLKHLQRANCPNDIICTQAKFTNEINKRLSLSAQRFLNASLGHIADYNEWLKAHCDLATD